MKLRNKKTGEIVDLVKGYIKDSYYGQKIEIKPLAISNKEGYMYNSLAELNAEWEDAPEEPKGSALDLMILTLANFIENEPDEDKVDLEDCKQMLEKLKAWKRLRDRGFIFSEWEEGTKDYKVMITGILPKGLLDNEQDSEDLDLLFDGGENE